MTQHYKTDEEVKKTFENEFPYTVEIMPERRLTDILGFISDLRSSDRATLIGEIEEWVGSNSEIETWTKVVNLDDLLAFLKELKEKK